MNNIEYDIVQLNNYVDPSIDRPASLGIKIHDSTYGKETIAIHDVLVKGLDTEDPAFEVFWSIVDSPEHPFIHDKELRRIVGNIVTIEIAKQLEVVLAEHGVLRINK